VRCDVSRGFHMRVIVLFIILAEFTPLLHGTQVSASIETFPSTVSAIEAIASRYKVRIGIEFSPQDVDNKTIRIDLSREEIAQALDSLTTQKPDYIWRIEDDVYDIYPRSGKDSLLDVTVHNFSVKDATPASALSAVDDLPEVQAWLSRTGVRRQELELNGPAKAPDKRVCMAATDLRLRNLLNLLLKEFGGGGWRVMRYGENGKFIAIYL